MDGIDRRTAHGGAGNPAAKLSEAEVRTIHQLFRNGQKYAEIAQTYGVTEHTVYSIVAGRSWVSVFIELYGGGNGKTLGRTRRPPVAKLNPVVRRSELSKADKRDIDLARLLRAARFAVTKKDQTSLDLLRLELDRFVKQWKK